MENKEQKIMKEINNLTPYLTELQEFKENGLYLPEGASGGEKPVYIFDKHGRRINKKRKSNSEMRHDLRVKALKLRVFAINKHLDQELTLLLPKLVIKLIRKYPRFRPMILKICFINISIVPHEKPKPFGSDTVQIKCFGSIHSEVKHVWAK